MVAMDLSMKPTTDRYTFAWTKVKTSTISITITSISNNTAHMLELN